MFKTVYIEDDEISNDEFMKELLEIHWITDYIKESNYEILSAHPTKWTVDDTDFSGWKLLLRKVR